MIHTSGQARNGWDRCAIRLGLCALVSLLSAGACLGETSPRKGVRASPSTRPSTGRGAATSAAKDSAKDLGYFVIPIKGRIGLYVTDDVFRQCLNLARARKAQVVILHVDCPGGMIRDLGKMLKTLGSYKDLRIVAYVERASSAAAVLSMACKEIVISPTGMIGGLVVYKVTPEGTPENLSEKWASILRARFRSVALNAGHEPLLVDGMMRTDVELRLMEGSERPRVVRGGDKGKLLKAEGKILSLDAGQAVACGLAIGQAKTVDRANSLLGIERWHRMPDIAKTVFAAWRSKLISANKQYRVAMSRGVSYYKSAAAAGPLDAKYDVHPKTGRMSAAARKLWWYRAYRSAALMKKAQEQLTMAGLLAEKYPQLKLPTEGIDETRGKIKELKEAIQADRKARGL